MKAFLNFIRNLRSELGASCIRVPSLGVAFLLMFQGLAYSSELIWIDFLDVIAAKETLMIKISRRGSNMAMKVTLGHGLSARTIGIVYDEPVEGDNVEKLNVAIEKLIKNLNESDVVKLSLKDFSSEIGLKPLELVRPDTLE